jgi:hypothetical protein
MALPMNTMPTFTLTVPSTGKNVKYRPFLVKDEKALMIAQQSEDIMVMVDTLKAVIKSCTLDDINVDSLATFDIEYMFTQIRSKSVGETIELLFSCDVDHGELNEKSKTKIVIDLAGLSVSKVEGHTNRIELFGDVGVVMKYPTINTSKQLEGDKSDDLENIFSIVAESIDYIYQGEEVYYAKEQKKEELLQFLNNLTTEQFLKVQKFFETMPKLSTVVEYTCPTCGKEHKKTLEGLQSFF